MTGRVSKIRTTKRHDSTSALHASAYIWACMETRWSLVCGLGILLGALSGCSSSKSAADDVGGTDAAGADARGAPDAQAAADGQAEASATADSSPAYPAFTPSLPQIGSGGTVITQPNVFNISFANEPLEADIDTFSSAMAGTTYWGDRVKEYGISPLTVGGRIHDPTVWPATVDDSAIQAWLIDRLAGDAGVAPGWPAPDMNDVFALYFPPGVTVTVTDEGYVSTSCVDFHGYHSWVTLPNNVKIAYAVDSRCDSIPEDPAATGINYVSAVISHELNEAITDPFLPLTPPPGTDPTGGGYWSIDPDHLAFQVMLGESELMDMCTLIPNGTGTTAFYTPADFGYVVQRGWSNEAARQGKDPCLPAPAGEVFFDTAPVLPDTVTTGDDFGVPVQTPGLQLSVGEKKTIELDLWSDGPTSGPWTVGAIEDQTSSLALSLNKSTGVNGDKLELTVEVKTTNANGGEVVVITSMLGGQGTYYPFVIVN